MNRYQEPPQATRDELTDAIQRGHDELIVERLVGLALNGGDPQWLTSMCIDLLEHPSTDVRRAAVVALGHLARIHRDIDRDRVVPRLTLLADDAALSGAAADALDDIATFAADHP